MSSKVQLCNLALARLGGSQITSLSDNTPEAKLCNLMYDDLAEEVMMEGMWTSCIKRASLADTGVTPNHEFSKEFQLPTDPRVLRLVRIDADIIGTDDYSVEGDKLYTNTASAKIEYIGFVDNPEDYDPLLKRAIVSRLASELAYPLTGSADVVNKMMDLYRLHIADGLALSALQGSSEEIVSTTLTDEVR